MMLDEIKKMAMKNEKRRRKAEGGKKLIRRKRRWWKKSIKNVKRMTKKNKEITKYFSIYIREKKELKRKE